MRILANENIPGETLEALRRLGHDVASIAEDSTGAADAEVLQRATDEDRIIITFDKDFGELAFRRGLPASSGVILLRLKAESPSMLTELILAALKSRAQWTGHFSVVERTRVRMRPLREADR